MQDGQEAFGTESITSKPFDFDGSKFLNANINGKLLEDKIIEKYAPNVVEGVRKLSNWAKNL